MKYWLILSLSIFLLFCIQLQAASVILTIENVTQTSPSSFTFDVCLKNSDSSPIEYAGGQYAILCNPAIGGGTLSMTAAGSDLAAVMQPRNPFVNTSFSDNSESFIKLQWAVNARLGAGHGLTIAAGGKVKIFTALLSGTSVFNAVPPNLAFYTGTNGLATKINAYISNTNTNVTSTASFPGAINNPVLPVELQSFVASMNSLNGRDVELKWQSATEINVNHYEVERSVVSGNSPARNWVFIDKKQASGNSNSPQAYSIYDRKLNIGQYAYRLKMVDNDGTFEYSKLEATAQVFGPKSFEMSQNYPNPFNPSTKIDYQVPADSRVTIELYSISGQRVATLVNEDKSAGYYTYSFSPGAASPALASGMYVYRLISRGNGPDNAFTSVKKMLYVK
jgi:hypothetical protein